MSLDAAVTPDTELVRKILGSAAYLVAAMRDPGEGVKRDSLSLEVRDSLDSLHNELDQAGLLDAYKGSDGGIAVW